MCSINHELKLIFIHTPKCGGLFVEKVLENCYGFETYYFTHENHNQFVDTSFVSDNNTPHDSDKYEGFLKITNNGVLRYFMSSNKHNEHTDMTLDKWNSYTKFAVKRNPYDRFISGCKFIKKENNILSNNLDIFMDKYSRNGYDYFHLYIPQYEHLIDTNNDFKIDYMINFENLNKELCYLLLKLGVTKIKHREALLNNVKLHPAIYESYNKCYNQELIDFVNTTFSIDFEKFQYKKVFNINELNIDSKNFFISEEQFCKNNIKLLIELDSKNQIISFDDDYYRRLAYKKKSNNNESNNNESNNNESNNNESNNNESNNNESNNNESNNNESNNNTIHTNNEIILPNGIILNTMQEKSNKNGNVRYNNFLKLLESMSKKSTTS
jgi:hypothetical protein